MFRRYTFFLLLISNLSFSQLSVNNDAYIFISDEIVFVEDDINLNDANSSIYLRSDAQVIQGSGVTGNSGIGELSVFQEGDVDQYEYNFWCSPIGSKTNNSVNNPFGITFLNDETGLITSTPAIIGGWDSHDGISSPLTISSRWIVKLVVGNDFSNWVYVTSTTNINPGEGFTMKGTAGSSSAQRYDFRGKPNNGTISVSVLDNQYTLVGNPYPSALDALEYIHDSNNKTVITGTLHYWEQNRDVNSHTLRDYQGGYATYTISIFGVPTYVPAAFSTYNNDGSINGTGSANTSTKQARRYIPVGQGFMVEGTSSIGSPVVQAKNSHRVYIKETNVDSEFFKNSNTKKETSEYVNGFSKVPSDHKRFRLNIDFNDTYTRQLAQTFHSSATKGFDYGMECKSFGLATDAHWVVNGDTFVAEALPFDMDLSIPLVINITNQSQVRIRITDIQNFESDQPIYVHDTENDTYVDLRTQDFNVNLDTNNYTDRFKIVFSNNNNNNNTSLSTNDISLDDLRIFQNNNISELKILNPNALNIKAISLIDVSGKEIENRRINISKDAHTLSTKSLSDGVYIVKISLDNNQVFNKKIIIANKK
ncbi:T9SS type A sorting domain-containing protein [Flavivirga jejuensis]|uniref:T9SS type A sorting domain-containing protein n=1 Tax=Flavivirga jejuensis TaxID=870487 RepID=A0ABT8WL79_9FLAO|nr:T9SS type A sorting domain-containing protein [Flavivirga jejuensis]MDO5973907.1 T9SS type A sorting domain-containing protein [Flavivirga jejuensis]